MENEQDKRNIKHKDSSIQIHLENELEVLKRTLSINEKLRVVWMPDRTNSLSGEVRDLTIYVYEPSGAQASRILVHELVDFYVSQAIEPYKEITNSLIKIINEEAYRKKEKVVETICQLLTEGLELSGQS